ncbi:hypothetical protein A2763_01960 [Candidatus Kaiserbacteria bacterium RIFCSPHIGHO2_01_FULL_54_36]|uniref:Uncharacterized protein n=1 Tax=Candidatus Kaiserbacteria bacterium RIFCSPHIGHO2_01_FULL_54_36 TaxID=1798482 RepID=A0A1F6CKP2_9BACT|nr:MAG: hypothetical protein A2763_01960 [Candidatus Kaiserbacteria bacterium RIFCSPHIGHO2_01_FULL_54_36]OGG75307.1 MAG: hypothetical protein A3A41_01315 [Candidatus Kaiserbacteria bacterium RIFCSPLOWO2_01_FULL_54_22]
MRLLIDNISGGDRGLVKRSLRRAIEPHPAIFVPKNGTVRSNTIVLVTVGNGPRGISDRERLSRTIDTVLSQCGYRFCNITHK